MCADDVPLRSTLSSMERHLQVLFRNIPGLDLCSVDLMGGLNFLHPQEEADICQKTPDSAHEVPAIEPASPVKIQPDVIDSPQSSQETVLSSDGDIGLMFMPSQPLASQKFLGFPTPEPSCYNVPSMVEAPKDDDDDIDADALFLPLSFKEYGY